MEKERLREELRKLQRDKDVELNLLQNRLQNERAQVQSDLAGSQARVAELEAELKVLEQKLQEAQAAVPVAQEVAPQGISEEAAEQIQELEAQVEELSAQMEELVAETGELSAAETIAMSRAARAERVVSEQTETIKSLRGEIERLRQARADENEAQTSADETAESREHMFAQRIAELKNELEHARVGRRDAEEAFRLNQSKVSNLTDELELLKAALEEKDNEFQVIADALVEVEEMNVQLERESKAQAATNVTALREENENLQAELARVRQQLQEFQSAHSSRDKVESTLLERDKEIAELQDEIMRLQDQVSEGAAENGSHDSGRVAELENELALSQRKLSRLEQTIIRLKGLRS